jgi:hypothetical protein
MRTYTWNVEQIETAILKIINCSEASNGEVGARERYFVDCLPAERERLSACPNALEKKLQSDAAHAKSLSRSDPFAKVG